MCCKSNNLFSVPRQQIWIIQRSRLRIYSKTYTLGLKMFYFLFLPESHHCNCTALYSQLFLTDFLCAFNRSWRMSTTPNTTKFFLIISKLIQQSNMVLLSCLANKNWNLNLRKKVNFITEKGGLWVFLAGKCNFQ